MRTTDHAAIQQAYDQLQNKSDRYIHRQHQVERYRDLLVSGDSQAFQEFIQLHPDVDVQHLRQLIRVAQKEAAENKPPARQCAQIVSLYPRANGISRSLSR